MKKSILRKLRGCEGFVSGQELCDDLHVSRTAVWKQIRQLQDEGYLIEAVPRRGYRLLAAPDRLSAEEVESRLKTGWVGHPVVYLPRVDSTNQYAKKRAEEGAGNGLLVITDDQTAGKGRSGRVWVTPPGTTVMMSLLLRPPLPPEKISMMTLLAALSVADTLRSSFGIDARIKWPNDIVADGKKLCGILTEMSCEISMVNYVVVGIGINANITQFPEDLADRAVSLLQLLGKSVDRARLIADTAGYLETYLDAFYQAGDLSFAADHYNEMLCSLGRGVRVLEPGKEYEGTARGINSRGELLVTDREGRERRVYAGEVSVRGIYGYV